MKKYLFTLGLLSLVLIGCRQEEGKELATINAQKILLCSDRKCTERFDIAKDLNKLFRDNKAIKHELMGVETGCRFEKEMEGDGWGETLRIQCAKPDEGYCLRSNCIHKTPKVKTICEGDTETIDSYSKP